MKIVYAHCDARSCCALRALCEFWLQKACRCHLCRKLLLHHHLCHWALGRSGAAARTSGLRRHSRRRLAPRPRIDLCVPQAAPSCLVPACRLNIRTIDPRPIRRSWGSHPLRAIPAERGLWQAVTVASFLVSPTRAQAMRVPSSLMVAAICCMAAVPIHFPGRRK